MKTLVILTLFSVVIMFSGVYYRKQLDQIDINQKKDVAKIWVDDVRIDAEYLKDIRPAYEQ